MKTLRMALLAGLILIYGCLFNIHEKNWQGQTDVLKPAMSAAYYQISAGYLSQLAAEALFIRTSVFLGGLRPGIAPASYVDSLGHNFEVISELYPRFIDTYFFCQGFLPHISPESATKASTIFSNGIAAYPQDSILHFFYASNFFLALDEPLKAAQAYTEAAKLPGAPEMFSHLAALLSARGGDIAAGLISLRAMLAVEKDEAVRSRLQQEIAIFEQAVAVNEALGKYIALHNTAPASLAELVPQFIKNIPVIEDSFVLIYHPPNLHLKRPLAGS